jgi:hypothetical protein
MALQQLTRIDEARQENGQVPGGSNDGEDDAGQLFSMHGNVLY